MSTSIQSIPTAIGVFQAHYGTPPGSSDAKADCEKWQRLCDELLAERARLRAELEKARLEQIFSEWGPIPSMEKVYAQVDREASLDDIIAQMKRELEAEK